MRKLNLSPINVFYLQQLSKLVKQKSNTRYHIADPTEMMHMLRFCCRSMDNEITTTFHAFFVALGEDERDFLESYGLNDARAC